MTLTWAFAFLALFNGIVAVIACIAVDKLAKKIREMMNDRLPL